MQTRSIEMLETLRKSTKKFSTSELKQFIDDVKKADAQELAAIIDPPKLSRTASKPKPPPDPFVKHLAALKKESGMKAADALNVLKRLLEEHSSSKIVPAKTRGSFPALLSFARAEVSDEDIRVAFEQEAERFKSRFSMRYDLS